MKHKILIPQAISPIGIEYLESHGCLVDMGCGTDEAEMIRRGQDCDGLLARTERISGNFLRSCKKLKVIGRHGVGVNNIDLQAAKSLGIRVTVTPTANSNTVAEHAMALICALSKELVFFDSAIRNNQFNLRNQKLVSDLRGKTLGIIGCGNIGRLLASKAKFGFEMNVVGYDPFIPEERFETFIRYEPEMDHLLQTSDFISLHLPATKDTYKLIGSSQFSMMQPSAFFINVARGEIVDETALFDALKRGVIAGAGIDVYDPEPPLPDNPLFGLPNCILTPHNAALSHEAMNRMALHAAMGIVSVLNGEEPQWPLCL